MNPKGTINRGVSVNSNRASRSFFSSLATAGLVLCSVSSQAQHGHLNAGAVSQDAGVPLAWINGVIFATNSGYVQTMSFSTNGTYSGYFNSGPTLTALPTSAANNSGGPIPFASSQGSFINYQLSLISAPTGGQLAFWEGGALTPTYSLGVGGTTPLIPLSDESLGAGSSGSSDPYGHIHGRRFTTTVVGKYVVGLQLFDTSDLGPGATPIHTPSEILYMAYTALPSRPIVGGHLNAGALGTNQNDKLVWANGALFAANSGYYQPLNYAATGTYAGYYNASGPTLTALPGTTFPTGLPPAMGSFIRAQMTLVSAPAGASFAFWTNSAGPAFSLNEGQSSPMFDLSDRTAGAGTPGGDPFGHLHGRRFTGTAKGDYIVDLRTFDTSTNGSGGGPIHTPSDAFLMDFRVVPIRPVLSAVAMGANQFTMALAGEPNQNYTIQARTNASSTNWTSLFVINSASATALFLTDTNATGELRLYRALAAP